MTKPALHSVQKQPQPDFTQQPGEWQEPADDFADAVAGALAVAATEKPPLPVSIDPKKRIMHARSNLRTLLANLADDKRAAEQRIAAADARLRERCDAAKREHDAELADAAADLDQVAACHAAFDLAVGSLNKAEPE